ncbi:MAG TPA: PGF-pre-PGF domain-containing protein [Alphaproteobacteria bacterium]|nr:PGF-pre-PGF domain-containing protein [Alphaproteobacteria bacterium]
MILVIFAGNAHAVLITSVSVSEQDLFYSNYTGNNIVHLKVNVTNITAGNAVTVTADFSNLGVNVCSGTSNNTLSLVDSGDGVWTAECDLGNVAAINSFKTGQVLIDARESNGGPTSPQGSITIGIYNVSIPQGNSCYRFTEGSTDFVQQNNFNSIDITLVVQAYGSSSCVQNGKAWGDSWITVAKIRFLGVNLVDPAKASKIQNLLDVVHINYSAPKSNQNNRLRIDTTQLNELSTNTFIEFYRLPFLTQPTIISDNTVPAQAVTWTSNGVDSILNYTTFNVSFTATPGFTGYTITDNSAPIITLSSPAAGQNFNDTLQVISASVNGTRTEVSQVLFYINNVLVAQYSNNGATNTANCNPSSSNLETYACSFNVTRTDGIYNISVVAYDFGQGPGNNATVLSSYVVQTGGPAISVVSPANGSTYHDTQGSVLKLNFSSSDGNGISRCWYTIAAGTGSQSSNVYLDNCNVSASLELYLASADYSLYIFANDTLGRISSKLLQFTVNDDNAPVLTDNTKANATLKKTTVLSINTDENATCKYDFSDVSYNKMKYSFVDKILSHNVTVNTSTNDTYKFFVRCEDMSENSNTASLSISLGTPSETVVNTTTDEFTDPHEIIDMGLLAAGQHIVEVDHNAIPFTDILVTTIGIADNVAITVSVPSKPTAKYAGTVYSYVEIVHGSLKDSLISEAKIRFSVTTKWLEDNKINASEISLYRYSNGKWVKLNTTITKVSGSKVEFIAVSPGLSLFAISTEEKVVVAAPVAATSTQASSNNTNTSLLREIVSAPEGKSNLVWWLVAILVFVLLVLYILAEVNYRNGPPPIFPREKTPWAKIKKLFR